MFYIVLYVKVSKETNVMSLFGYIGDSKTTYLLIKLDDSLIQDIVNCLSIPLFFYAIV